MPEIKEVASGQERMIRQQIIERGIDDARVIAALRAIPREAFFPPDARADAYADRAAPIGHDQTISQPYMVALMTHRLDIRPGHRVLEIGTGSGYQSAVLAKLAAEVYTIEHVKPLIDGAWERLMAMGVRNVHFRHGDGTIGWPDAGPFDRILITAAGPTLPRELLTRQLTEGGIAVLPVGAGDDQMLVRVTKAGEHLQSDDICTCRFVKLIRQEGFASA